MRVNPYYDRSECGLAKVGMLDEDGLSWEFHMLMVVKHEASGRIFYATDSGCSCPTPFEGERFDGPDNTSLIEITRGDSMLSFVREVEGFPAQQSEREALISAVTLLLKENHAKQD